MKKALKGAITQRIGRFFEARVPRFDVFRTIGEIPLELRPKASSRCENANSRHCRGRRTFRTCGRFDRCDRRIGGDGRRAVSFDWTATIG